MEREAKHKVKKPRIKVTDEITSQLVAEFNVTNQTVLVALKFHTESELADSIRARAIQLMEETQKENKKLLKKHA